MGSEWGEDMEATIKYKSLHRFKGLLYPGIEFKQRKWLFKQNGVIE